jgi:hypothetical protein
MQNLLDSLIRFARSSSTSLTESTSVVLMVLLHKTPMLSWSSSSLVRHSADSRRHSRQVRHEGFAMSRHAPDRSQQLTHRCDDHRDFAGFACGPKAFIVLTQPRVAAGGVENHHPERLAQAGVSERNCWTAREALLARLPQPRRDADVARDRTELRAPPIWRKAATPASISAMPSSSLPSSASA